MARMIFSSLGENDSAYYDDVHQDFHPHVSDIYFEDDGTFTVEASHDFLDVFNRQEEDGSGLCQNYSRLQVYEVQ